MRTARLLANPFKLSAEGKRLTCLILLSVMICLCAGMTSPISLGDEIHHYRFAKHSYEVGGRATHDPLFKENDVIGFTYSTGAFWPVSVAWLFRLAGGPSPSVAQLYQVFYLVVLILSTYFLARRMYGESVAFWSAAVVSSIPMVTSFSILFYLDLPACAVVMAAFLFLRQKRYLALGFMLAAAFVLKRNTAFFLPIVFLFICYQERAHVKRLITALSKSFLTSGALVLCELIWRNRFLPKSESMLGQLSARVRTISNQISGRIPGSDESKSIFDLFRRIEFTNSNVFNPIHLVQYMGIVALVAILVYVGFKLFEKKDLFILSPLIFYVGLSFFMRLLPEIRYLLPAVGFVAIIAAKSVANIVRRWPILRYCVFGLCIIQMVGAAGYTHSRRQIPPGIQEGFEYIRENTPKDSLVMYPESNLMEYAERRMVWTRSHIQFLIWRLENELMRGYEILRIGLDYIAIKKARIYDEHQSKILHAGGYPMGFTQMLSVWPYAEVVFENDDMLIYHIDRKAIDENIETFKGKFIA